MVILAERYKKGFGYLLILGLLGFALFIPASALGDYNGWYLVGMILFLSITAGAVYGCLLPKEAIVRDGDKLIFRYLFKTKTRLISDLKYASHHEIGTWHRNDDSLWEWLTFKNDVRRITVTFEQNGITEQIAITVEQATAVAVALNGLVEE